MKRTIPSILIITATMLWACNFSTETKKVSSTGLTYEYKGFSVKEVVLTGSNNVAMSTNEIQLGKPVVIVVRGLSNYELKEEKAFPGFTISVTDKGGASVLDSPDLFEGSDGFSAADASVLRGTFTAIDPLKVGATYHVKVRVWDKNKPENELIAEVDLVVK